MSSILRIENLSKSFGGKQAIADVSFSITEGSITGFLGPNGSGKSTTMNLIMGFIKASSGRVQVFDTDVVMGSAATRRRVGFLSNSSQLDRSLTVAQSIEYYGAIGGAYEGSYVAELVQRLKLDTSQKIGGLSTGNYQKVAIVVALMHRPKLLILDEPTNGLDPLIQAEFNKIIFELKEAGSTIFISSHILSEVQELCDEFIFIKNGRIAAQLTRSELLGSANKVVTIKTTSKNHDEVIKYLQDHTIEYAVGSEDLDEIFMKYYGDDHA